MTLDPSQTVATLVLDHSECAEVFQRHRIDFCCRGELSIADAARAKGVALEPLLDELGRAIEARDGGRATLEDPRALTTASLLARIVSTHHEYLRNALPFVRALATKVSRVHGDHNPKLRALDEAVTELADTLVAHIDAEESSLFPALASTAVDRAAIAFELAEMLEEHLQVAALLGRVRAAADDFIVPSWGCHSYRTLFSELRQLERDVFAHVHLENHVLRPRFATA